MNKCRALTLAFTTGAKAAFRGTSRLSPKALIWATAMVACASSAGAQKVPEAPGNPLASAGDGLVALYWVEPGDGGSALTSYGCARFAKPRPRRPRARPSGQARDRRRLQQVLDAERPPRRPTSVGLGRYPVVTLGMARAGAGGRPRDRARPRSPALGEGVPTFAEAMEIVIAIQAATGRTAGAPGTSGGPPWAPTPYPGSATRPWTP